MLLEWLTPLAKAVKDPRHRFLFFLCKTFGQTPDSDFLEEMDPAVKLWLYNSWAYDQEQEIEKIRNHAIFTGSFANPEMASKLVRKENPQFKSSEQDFDESYKLIEKSIAEEEENKGLRVSKRKRRVLNG